MSEALISRHPLFFSWSLIFSHNSLLFVFYKFQFSHACVIAACDSFGGWTLATLLLLFLLRCTTFWVSVKQYQSEAKLLVSAQDKFTSLKTRHFVTKRKCFLDSLRASPLFFEWLKIHIIWAFRSGALKCIF